MWFIASSVSAFVLLQQIVFDLFISFFSALGCGINVDNEKPTLCVNQLLAEGIAPLSCEVVIARAVSRFEDLLEIFERRGLDGILPIYYKYWLHE